MSYDYYLVPAGEPFTDEQIGEMRAWLEAELPVPVHAMRPDFFWLFEGEATKGAFLRSHAGDGPEYGDDVAPSIWLRSETVVVSVALDPTTDAAIAAFVRWCISRWPCHLEDLGDQPIDPDDLVDPEQYPPL